MVKANDVNKDIREIAKKVKTAVFSYDEIHNSSIPNEFHYDYKKVISEVSSVKEISEEEAVKLLIGNGTLSTLPNGEYKVNVGKTTEGGGGLNYGGDTFFSLSSKDYRVKYHELAHSLQDEYDLFNGEKLDEIYQKTEASLKSGEKKEDKLVNRGTYKQYLNEMHSESFSYAAMMLRSENKLDFAWQEICAYSSGIGNNVTGLFLFGKTEYGADNNQAKFYATLPIMRETIKKIHEIRKAGKVKDFFDENGVLNDEKLAKVCEEVVLKNSYSPRTLNSFFKYKLADSHGKSEHGWRGDSIKATLLMPVAILTLPEAKPFQTINKIISHSILRGKEKRKISEYLKTPQKYANPEMQALKDYEKLQVITDMLNDNVKGYFKIQIGIMVNNGTMPQSVISFRSRSLPFKVNSKKLASALTMASKIVEKNQDNPSFKILVQGRTDIGTVRNLIAEKEKNPSQNVIDEKKIPFHDSMPDNLYTLERSIEHITKFAEKYKLNPSTVKKLIDTRLNSPMAMDTPSYREHMANDIAVRNNIRGFKKGKMISDFNEMIDRQVSFHYNDSSNPKYLEALERLKDVSFSEIKATIKELDEEFSKRGTEKKEVADEVDKGKELPELSPKEKVEEKLSALGIEKGSYILITPENNIQTGYESGSGRDTSDYFFSGKKSVEQTGEKVVYGVNNGVVGAYFAEGVYIVSSDMSITNKLYLEGKDVGLGVMFSNGEQITNDPQTQKELEVVLQKGREPKKTIQDKTVNKNTNTEDKTISVTKVEKTVLLTNKEKIAALSGRSGSNMSATAQQEQTTPVVTVMKETIKKNTVNSTPNNSSVKAEQVTENAAKPKESFPQKIADMSKEKLGKFVSLLRKGYNSISGEGINPTKPAKTVDKTNQQTNAVQASAIKMQQNSGNSGR